MRCSATWPASRSTRRSCRQRAYGQYGLDRYEAVDYRVVRDEGERGLEIDLRRKSWGPNFLRVGMSIESDYEGGTYANAGARLLMTGVNRLDGEVLFDAQLGEDPHFHAELFQPLSLTTEFFVAPAFHYDLETLQIVRGRAPRGAVPHPRHAVPVRGRRGALELGRGAAGRAARRPAAAT